MTERKAAGQAKVTKGGLLASITKKGPKGPLYEHDDDHTARSKGTEVSTDPIDRAKRHPTEGALFLFQDFLCVQ